ncbi:MAG: hypothetical protein M1820_009371 [Bogoriella megaspora]|nr:MAG: hypothetical protein M1820_009371 [Bogoriella megaspora]
MTENDDFAIDPDVAISMGFSSFGTQPSQKRRKYNASSDAVIAADEAKVHKESLSGTNVVALGVRSKPVVPDLGVGLGQHNDLSNKGPSPFSGSRSSVAGNGNYVEKKIDEMTPAELNALRKGVRNGKGDIAYFKPSFIEDPWADAVAQ